MRLCLIFGTRPEIIKMFPIYMEAKRRGHDVTMVHTGQHFDLAKPFLDFFKIKLDFDLQVMRPGSTLSALSARIVESLEANKEVLLKSDMIMVQGDTTSALMGAYWAFCNKIPVAHLEAGLRTYNLQSPYPEEANRQLVGRISDIHFAPTSASAQSLLNEGVNPKSIHTIGNTSVDAILYVKDRLTKGDLPDELRLPTHAREFLAGSEYVLVTSHRRENVGDPLAQICSALIEILKENPKMKLIWPVHPNPDVSHQVNTTMGQSAELASDIKARIMLCEPQGYVAFAELMNGARLIVTDSGGVQEEGPSLDKAIFVVRTTTERPEGVTAGFADLVGTNKDKILQSIRAELRSPRDVTKLVKPYGDGTSRIQALDIIEEFFKHR